MVSSNPTEIFYQVVGKMSLVSFLPWQPQDAVCHAKLGINAAATCVILVHIHPTAPPILSRHPWVIKPKEGR